MFVDISGIDGCGKSTLARLLMSKLLENGISSKVFHGYIPRNNMYMLKDICIKAGMKQEESSSINTLGMAAALMDIYCNTQKVFADMKTEVLISEKYIKDSVVYMPLLGGNKELALIYERNLPNPDVRIILDIDPYLAYERVLNRSQKSGKHIQEKEQIKIMREARKKFLEFEGEQNTYIIDGSQNVNYILEQVFEILKKYL